MASFAAQLQNKFFDLAKRVTGYSLAGNQHVAAGAQQPAKLASAASQTEQVVPGKHTEIRARGTDNLPDDVPNVSRGSLPQVHTRNL